jgi:hypothetical protein
VETPVFKKKPFREDCPKTPARLHPKPILASLAKLARLERAEDGRGTSKAERKHRTVVA